MDQIVTPFCHSYFNPEKIFVKPFIKQHLLKNYAKINEKHLGGSGLALSLRAKINSLVTPPHERKY